jgi:hypothetical protein
MKNLIMRKGVHRFVALVAVFAFSMLLTQAVSAQGKQDFTLHNETGVVISELYVSPHSSNQWEEDVLGRDVLADGESVEIQFSRRAKPKFWDIKIVDKDGESLIWEKLNLLEISEVTLYFEDGRAWADLK